MEEWRGGGWLGRLLMATAGLERATATNNKPQVTSDK